MAEERSQRRKTLPLRLSQPWSGAYPWLRSNGTGHLAIQQMAHEVRVRATSLGTTLGTTDEAVEFEIVGDRGLKRMSTWRTGGRIVPDGARRSRVRRRHTVSPLRRVAVRVGLERAFDVFRSELVLSLPQNQLPTDPSARATAQLRPEPIQGCSGSALTVPVTGLPVDRRRVLVRGDRLPRLGARRSPPQTAAFPPAPGLGLFSCLPSRCRSPASRDITRSS